MKSIWSDDSWLHADTPINYLEEIWRHAALSKSWPVIHWISIGSKRFGFFWWYRFAPWETHWLPIKLNSKPNTAGAKTTLWKNHRRWREKQASHREALSHCHENSWNLLKLNLWSDWLYNPVQTLKPETKANMRGQTTKCLLSKRKEFEFKQLHRFWTQNTAALGWSLARPSLGSMSRLLLLLATVRQHKTPAKCWNVLKPEMKIRGKQKFKKRHRSCQELPPRDVTDANDAKFHLKEVCVLKMHPCEVVYHVHAFVPVQAPNDVGASKFNWDWCCWWLKSNEMKYIEFWKERENVNQWCYTFTVTYWQ